jgi:hypothetical protein
LKLVVCRVPIDDRGDGRDGAGCNDGHPDQQRIHSCLTRERMIARLTSLFGLLALLLAAIDPVRVLRID